MSWERATRERLEGQTERNWRVARNWIELSGSWEDPGETEELGGIKRGAWEAPVGDQVGVVEMERLE